MSHSLADLLDGFPPYTLLPLGQSLSPPPHPSDMKPLVPFYIKRSTPLSPSALGGDIESASLYLLYVVKTACLEYAAQGARMYNNPALLTPDPHKIGPGLYAVVEQENMDVRLTIAAFMVL